MPQTSRGSHDEHEGCVVCVTVSERFESSFFDEAFIDQHATDLRDELDHLVVGACCRGVCHAIVNKPLHSTEYTVK